MKFAILYLPASKEARRNQGQTTQKDLEHIVISGKTGEKTNVMDKNKGKYRWTRNFAVENFRRVVIRCIT